MSALLIADLIKEKAARWVQAEMDSEIIFCTDVESYNCSGPCECCGDEDWLVDVTYEVPKTSEQTFYGHVKIARFNGSLKTFIDYLDRRYP